MRAAEEDRVSEPEDEYRQRWSRLRDAGADFWPSFWMRLKEGFGIAEYEDEHELFDLAWPDPRPELRVPAQVIWFLLFIGLLAGIYYFSPPVHRVTDAGIKAIAQAVKQETKPDKKDKDLGLGDKPDVRLRTVMPSEERGEVFVSVLDWIERRQPGISLRKQLDEMDTVDSLITWQTGRMLILAERTDATHLYVRTTCTAGDPAKPCLILAVGDEDEESEGYTFAVWRNGDDYDYRMLNDYPGADEPVVEDGVPWLKAIDLDLDGSTEILETWQSEAGELMHLQVHKLVSGYGWKRILNVHDVWFGQVKIARSGAHSVPWLLVSEARGSEDDAEITGYMVSVYAWDRKREALTRIKQYPDDKRLVK